MRYEWCKLYVIKLIMLKVMLGYVPRGKLKFGAFFGWL